MFRRNGYKVTVTGWLELYMNYRDKYHFYRIRRRISQFPVNQWKSELEQETEWKAHYVCPFFNAESSFLVGFGLTYLSEIGSNLIQAEFIAEVKKQAPDTDSQSGGYADPERRVVIFKLSGPVRHIRAVARLVVVFDIGAEHHA